MKKRKVYIITLIAVFLLFVLLSITMISGSKVSMNPAGTVGNTAGNLNNSGLFCEYDGVVYFSNPYDSGCLYSMAADEDDIKKLNSVSVQNILAGGDYLYYFRLGNTGSSGLGNIGSLNGLNRCLLNGRDATNLTRDTVISAQLVDNYLYVLSASDKILFYKLKIDNSEQVTLANYEINPACADNGIIYYNGTKTDHNLYGLNTANDTSFEIWDSNLWYPVKQGDYIYYLDVPNNYRLCRYSLAFGTVEVLTDDRVDCFNVGNGYIYYQKNGEAASLNCMYTDGSNVQIIAEGNFTNINMTSQYVYFQEYGNSTITYHSCIGSGTYNIFHAAKEAVQ